MYHTVIIGGGCLGAATAVSLINTMNPAKDVEGALELLQRYPFKENLIKLVKVKRFVFLKRLYFAQLNPLGTREL